MRSMSSSKSGMGAAAARGATRRLLSIDGRQRALREMLVAACGVVLPLEGNNSAVVESPSGSVLAGKLCVGSTIECSTLVSALVA